jgi:hypothetical protein
MTPTIAASGIGEFAVRWDSPLLTTDSRIAAFHRWIPASGVMVSGFFGTSGMRRIVGLNRHTGVAGECEFKDARET